MTVELGSGAFRFRVVDSWAQLPDGWELGDVGGVGVDREDRVYVFNRGPHPMMVFDSDGTFLTSWGEGLFPRAHGVSFGPDDTIYLTDDGDHTMRKCTLDGTVLLEIGTPGVPAPFMSGVPFNRCTHTALSPEGDIYISDGYGNARIHKYAQDGTHLLSFGEPGAGPGQFNLPHNLGCDEDGFLYVADRENHRVQVFSPAGKFEDEWHSLHRPSALLTMPGRKPHHIVGEIGPYYEFNRGAPNLGPRLSVLAPDGSIVTRLGVEPNAGTEPGQFLSPHGLAMDSKGDLYVAEVAVTGWPSLFPGQPLPRPIRSLQKLEHLPDDTAGEPQKG